MSFQKINSLSYISNGTTFLLAYFPDSKEIFYCGSHRGEISGKNIIVESFTSIQDTVQRVKDLELNLTKEQADEIIYRASLKNVTLPKSIKDEILDYPEKIKEIKKNK